MKSHPDLAYVTVESVIARTDLAPVNPDVETAVLNSEVEDVVMDPNRDLVVVDPALDGVVTDPREEIVHVGEI